MRRHGATLWFARFVVSPRSFAASTRPVIALKSAGGADGCRQGLITNLQMPPGKWMGGALLLTPRQNQIEAAAPSPMETPLWRRCTKTKWKNSFCWVSSRMNADLIWKTVMIHSRSYQQFFTPPYNLMSFFFFVDLSFHIDTHLIFSRYQQPASVRIFLFI